MHAYFAGDELQASREAPAGVHALCVSAEGAVDNDLVQSALEEGELLIIELGDEQLRDPAGVDGRRLTEAGDARLGERHHDTTGIGTRSVSANEAFIDQPGDATGHARTRDERPVRQFGHAQLTVGRRQLSEHVEVGQGQTRLSLQIRVESADERGVGPQQRAPGLQPPAARHLILYEPVEELCDIGLRKYLHVHLLGVKYLQAQAYSGEAAPKKERSVSIELQLDLDPSIKREFGTLAGDARVTRTAAALEANGISVLRASDAAEAKRVVLRLIPDGSQIHHGASQSLEASGIIDEVEKSGRFDPVRPRIGNLDRKTEADEIRRLSAAPDVMLGSVHAVTETGSLLAASMSGSQLGPYASGAGRVILVVGTQKIVSDLQEGLRRINEYAFPLEDARAQAAYGIHSAVNKVLIINREIIPERITVVLVDEVLGF